MKKSGKLFYGDWVTQEPWRHQFKYPKGPISDLVKRDLEYLDKTEKPIRKGDQQTTTEEWS